MSISSAQVPDSLVLSYIPICLLPRFFDTTPLGLILNRFSADTNIIDQVSAWVTSKFRNNFFQYKLNNI